MDPALSSLFPIHQIGADGFSWWIGQIESGQHDDPKKSGRYRVRIVGQHLKSCDATPTEELPWAQVMMPVTTPFSDGGTTGASVGLKLGNWVVGFYVDNDKQKPIIMGSIGHTAGATKLENVESDPNPEGSCKGFTTFQDPEVNPNVHKPLGSSSKRSGDSAADSTTAEDTGTTKPGEAGLPAAAVPDQMPSSFYGLFGEESSTNPTGGKVCVEIADPNCGSENDLKGGLTKIIGDMLKASQQSGGNLGSYYVSQVNGELNSYIDHGMQYVNKAVRLVKSFVARIKGEIVKLVREGVDELVDLILYTDAAAEDALGNVNTGPVAPDLGIEPFQPITKKESKLKPILDTINDVLDDLGCSMADFTDQIAKWLTDLLLGYLMDAFSNAACLVDNVVDGVINQILSLIEELLNNVLGPLQQILSILASPLDIIGNAVAKVLGLLGISCDGPSATCEKVKKECTDCDTGDDEDWLDKLLAQIEDGELDSTTYVCDEAKTTSVLDDLPPTKVTFIGGTYPDPEPDEGTGVVPFDGLIEYGCEDIEVTEGEKAVFTITRAGDILSASSLTVKILGGTATENEDYAKIFTGSSIGFAPGATKKELVFETYKDSSKEGPETFFIKFEENVTPTDNKASFVNGKVAKCTINDFDSSTGNSPTSPPGETPVDDPFVPPSLETTQGVVLSSPIQDVTKIFPEYSVTTDKKFYKEGETIVYTVETTNVSNLGPYTYTIEGDIDADDIVGGQLTGEFTLLEDGTATFGIELATNDDIPDTVDEDDNPVVNIDDVLENITLYIDDTTAYAEAYVLPDDDILITQPIWSVISDVNYISEGETANFTVETLNVPDGINFKYRLTGDVTREDIVGNRIVSSVDQDKKPLLIKDGVCVVPIQAAGDGVVEDKEVFNFVVESYDVEIIADWDYDAENNNRLTNVRMVIDGQEVSDLSILLTEGMEVKSDSFLFKIDDDTTVTSINPFTNTITLSSDLTIYNTETLDLENQTFTLTASVKNSAGNPVFDQVVIRSELDEDDGIVPTFNVSADKLVYKEGETITYTVTTSNVDDGTVLQYTLYGDGITVTDFDNKTLFGNFIVYDNEAKVYVGISDDTDVESDETVTFLINGTSAFTDVIITDSTSDTIEDPVISKPPCFTKPIAGAPITDSRGAIISIPIVDQGCPYVFPPKVIITGPGYGAGGIALLDPDGKVSEVRVTRTGTGYNVNQNPELRCVIDSYTLIKPGSGYTSTPDVYVDGVAGRAIAVIDERGYLISVQPTDRTTTWNEIPIVKIIGGGGSGARVIPSVTCLDTKEYEDQGYAKIGTGRYIDCP